MDSITVKTTFKYILDHGDWDTFCEMKGFNPWMLNEGLANGDEPIELTMEEAKKIGII
jgi:hypothetical protein